jgi:hypothetical protein
MWPRMIVRTLQHCLSHSYFTCKAGPVRRRQSRHFRVALQRIRRFFCSPRPHPPAPWLSPHPRGSPQTPPRTLQREAYIYALYAVRAVDSWNELPESVRAEEKLPHFKRKLKVWQHRYRYAPGRKEMEKEKGKRKLQENSKRKEQRKKSLPGGSLHFGLKKQQEWRMADHNGSTDVSTTPLLVHSTRTYCAVFNAASSAAPQIKLGRRMLGLNPELLRLCIDNQTLYPHWARFIRGREIG